MGLSKVLLQHGQNDDAFPFRDQALLTQNQEVFEGRDLLLTLEFHEFGGQGSLVPVVQLAKSILVSRRAAPHSPFFIFKYSLIYLILLIVLLFFLIKRIRR